MNGYGSVPVKPDIQKQVADWIWPVDCNLLTPGLSKECYVHTREYHATIKKNIEQSLRYTVR